jgi:hypothetical protein
MLRLFFLSLFTVMFFAAAAQDSAALQLPVADSTADSVQQKKPEIIVASVISYDSVRAHIITRMLRLNTQSNGEFVIQQPKQIISKDWLFYYILGLLFMFGVLRIAYPRYFNDLFRFFFRTSLRVNQIREQLVQSGLQSLFFNTFFAFSFGVYLFLLLSYFKSSLQVSAWLVPVGASACLLLLYLGKYVFLKISGWLFSIETATETYTFIVFLINKVAGIVILPFVIVIAFSTANIVPAAVSLSLIIVAGLFLYRFLRAYRPLQSEVKLSRVHFFLFFIGVEIAPLLLIYKVLVRFF